MKLRDSANTSSLSWKNLLWIGGLHVLAVALVVPFFTWQGVVAFFVLHYLAGMVGVTFGFHRLLTHRSFKVPAFIENLAALCGTLACQGGPISWVGTHRLHHMFSDRHEDPHNASKGFLHAHLGWILNRRQDLDQYEEFKHYASDLAARPFFRFLENNMILVQNILGWGLMFGVAFAARGADGVWNWHMGISVVVYGIFLRLVAGYHVTWFVNSAAHKWGTNDNNINDLSKNNWWVAILAFGEGWHNNHHAQPRSARHGWKWWQFDQTWIMICVLKTLRLASHIQLPKVKELRPSAAGPELTLNREAAVLARDQ